MRRPAHLLALLPLLAGCGGHGGGSSNRGVDTTSDLYHVDPKQDIDGVNFAEAVTATASIPVDDITFKVAGIQSGSLSYTQEPYVGDSGTGGVTLPPLGFDAAANTSRVTYITPNRLGTYRVIASFVKDGKVVATRTAIIGVSTDVGYGV